MVLSEAAMNQLFILCLNGCLPRITANHLVIFFLYFSDLNEEVVVTESMVESQAIPEKQTTSTAVQTDVCFDDLKMYTNSDLQDTQKLQRSLFMKYVLKDDQSCKFYTGI